MIFGWILALCLYLHQSSLGHPWLWSDLLTKGLLCHEGLALLAVMLL